METGGYRYMYMDPAYRHLVKLRGMAKSEKVSSELTAEIDKIIQLSEARMDYCENHTSTASEELQYLMDSTQCHPWKKAYQDGQLTYHPNTIMLSGNIEGQFLKSLVSIGNVSRVLELGLFTGCSALAFAEALPDGGKVVSCEMEPYIAELARSLLEKSSVGKKVDIMLGPAKDSLKKLSDKKMEFDLIFIDADKSNYSTYYKMIFEYGLLAKNGTILVDNALFFGDPYSNEDYMGRDHGIGQFNEMVKQDDRVHQVLLPIRDGLLLIRRKEDMQTPGGHDQEDKGTRRRGTQTDKHETPAKIAS
ncbi:O-methyltransferase MdmC-like [Saccostrea echinata]|uniref:O-methyltransferase MdmC-like n=1 Tax=Saccostrea echinata TaxID=191078 RepID=UPI002A7F260C|nr:O-methyltransferase MdmC-like [Saccostrea echinata]